MSKILLVDDDVDLTDLLKTKLSAEGYEIAKINTGVSAFDLAKQFKPDILIIDVMLPGMTGYEICRKIRKDPQLYAIAILILTALGEEPEIIHGLEQGADDYLVKPFKLDNLLKKIASLSALLDAVGQRGPLTKLPGTDAIKREINHRLARGTAIAVCYIDIVGFKPYCAVHGKDGQNQTQEFMGNLLVDLRRNLGIYEGFAAHLGGEHFAILLNLEDYERFCTALIQTFDQQVSKLHSKEETARGTLIAHDSRGRETSYPLMALSVGVTHTQYHRYKNANKMFESLAQVRQVAQPDGKSVVFVDRRHAER